MKKTPWIIALGLMLTLTLTAPALAATTAVDIDGKSYYFAGGQGSYEADGKTFIIGKDTVRVQQPGKPDQVFPLGQDNETSIAQEISGVYGDVTISDHDSAMTMEGGFYSTEAVEISEDIYLTDGRYNETNFAQYARFGLEFNEAEQKLYYQGQEVRIFEDSYSIDENTCAVNGYFNESGTIDIVAERDFSNIMRNADGSFDPSGTLTGLRVLSKEEFDSRNLTAWIAPEMSPTTAVSGEPLSAAEKQAQFAKYADLGIYYDAQKDQLLYQGQVIRTFLDVQKSNGASFSSGHFQGSMTQIIDEEGSIDVTVIRDYNQVDSEGNGLITGVRVE